jgi:hypothetical protein
MKTTWNIIHKEKGNPIKENYIKLLRINNCAVHNQTSIANELNEYFLNTAGSTSNKRNDGKNEDGTHIAKFI